MILADTNFWLALSLSRHTFHQAARNWLAGQSTAASLLFCRSTQWSFLRLLTTEAVMRPYGIPPMINSMAWSLYENLLSDRRIKFVPEPPAIETRWKQFAQVKTASPKLWMDAYLAAFAIAGGYQLLTTDQGFKQFAGLDLILLP